MTLLSLSNDVGAVAPEESEAAAMSCSQCGHRDPVVWSHVR
jgi:hypothetical protein